MNTLNPRPLLILSALLFAAGSAHAEDTTVNYADLNLASQSGVATLYKRLARAADRVCGEHEGRSLREHAAFRECREASLNRAVQQIDHPGVVALHAAQQAGAVRG
jgi:UrcA family protein